MYYLLVAGGMNPGLQGSTVSSRVKLIIIQIINQHGQLIIEHEKTIDYEIESFLDYFPNNQWINADSSCQDGLKQGSGSYLVLGTRGVSEFTIDLSEPDYPRVDYQLKDQSFKFQ